MPAPVLTFTYLHERDASYWALPVPVQLRAAVELRGNDEPLVEVVDRAVWEDALGPETVGTKLADDGKSREAVRNPAWIGAEEAAIDAAVERVSSQATEQSNQLAGAV
jgi:hypothetical protein